MWPLLELHPCWMPATLLEHLQEQQPVPDPSPAKRTLPWRDEHHKELLSPALTLMLPLAYRPGEIGS